MDFPTEDALKRYLQQHPGADKSKHKVTKSPARQKVDPHEKMIVSPLGELEKYKGESPEFSKLMGMAGKREPSVPVSLLKKGIGQIDSWMDNWDSVSKEKGWGRDDRENLSRARAKMNVSVSGPHRQRGTIFASDERLEQLRRAALANPKLRAKVVPLLRRAMEFPTEDALKRYLKEHPGADKSKHRVTKGPARQKVDPHEKLLVSPLDELEKFKGESPDLAKALELSRKQQAEDKPTIPVSLLKKGIGKLDELWFDWDNVSQEKGWGADDKEALGRARAKMRVSIPGSHRPPGAIFASEGRLEQLRMAAHANPKLRPQVVALLRRAKEERNIPKYVEELAKDITKFYTDQGEAKEDAESKGFATAWSIWCKYKDPGSEHCSRPPSGYFTGKE